MVRLRVRDAPVVRAKAGDVRAEPPPAIALMEEVMANPEQHEGEVSLFPFSPGKYKTAVVF